MKQKFLLLVCLFVAYFVNAQTWNGSISTDWNTAANWTPATIPIATSDVTIPGTANKPKLVNNITVNTFTMNLSSGLDFNGFTLISNGAFDINGATLTNSNGTTDISITLNGTGTLYIRQSVINDDIVINHSSTSGFYEGYQFPNTFNGNVTINSSAAGLLSLCYDTPSSFNGNLIINRTVAGVTEIFRAGAAAVTGNFSYANNAGGNTSINPLGIEKVSVAGTVNISATGAANPSFLMRWIQNSTSGGTISVQNSGMVDVNKDTLLLSAFNVSGFTGTGLDDFLQNQITGTVNISDDATNNGFIYFRGNIINGNASITVNSAAAIYEGYQYPGIYNGNTIFTCNNSALLSICYDTPSSFNGNLSINRTVAGTTEIFRAGAATVTGNFSYTNNAGGNTAINPIGIAKVPITGTVNISATGAANPDFSMRWIQNSTNGGTISVQNSGMVDVNKDTLLLSALNINGFISAGLDDFLQNQITGTVSISDVAANTGFIYFRGNIINGNTAITVNSTGGFYESYQYGNTYNGNLSLVINNGAVFFAYDNPTVFNQNFTINSASGISFTNNVIFGGSNNGAIEQSGTQPIIFPLMQMQKTGAGNLTLNSSVTVSNNLTFNGGNIISSIVNPLIFTDDAIYTGTSNTSHVTGPVVKTGNDVFTFPVGSPTSLNTVAITAPALATDKFSTQYFLASPASVGDTSLKDPDLKKLSNCEYWDIKRLTGTSAVTLTFGFGDPCSDGMANYINNPATIKIAHWTGSAWENLGNGGSTGAITGTVTTGAPVNSFSPFTFGSVDVAVNPLPVTLLSFNAAKCNNGICLLFNVENEINFARYEVEKSSDGTKFTQFKTVWASGNTAQTNYSAIDNQPFDGLNYYRLKMIDKDDRFTYSEVIKINNSKKYTIGVSPNPAADYMIITGAGDFRQIQIMDAAGKVLKLFNKNINNRYNLTGLAKGIYFVRLLSARENFTIKIVIKQ
jgi:hypothetical protein